MNVWVVVNVNHAGNFHTKGEAVFAESTPEACEEFIEEVKRDSWRTPGGQKMDDMSIHGPFWVELPEGTNRG